MMLRSGDPTRYTWCYNLGLRLNAIHPKKPSRGFAFLGLTWGMLACGGGIAPIPTTPDAGPQPDTILDPITLIPEVLAPQTPYWAAGLGGGDVLAAFDDRLLHIRTTTTARLDPPSGRIVGIAAGPQGKLLAASDGIHALHEQGLVRSPLSDALAGLEPVDLLSAGGEGAYTLWIAGRTQLAYWSDGQVHTVAPQGLPTSDCRLASTLEGPDRRWVWAACAGRLYALVPGPEGLQAQAQVDVSDVRSLAADGVETLWVVNGAGEVWSRDPGDAWRPHTFASDALRVRADGPDAWFETMSGLWHHGPSGFAAVNSPTSLGLLASLADGQVLLQTAEGLVRGSLRRGIRFEGLAPNALIEAPTLVTLAVVTPAQVESVLARLDDAPLSVREDLGWSVFVDTSSLSDGSHELQVEVTYADGEQVQSSLRFSYYAGPVPTWTGDVQPIFEARCAICHGNQSGARRLDGAELWQEQITSILENVTTERMPLPPNPPLTREELDRIEGWVAAGFPEGN